MTRAPVLAATASTGSSVSLLLFVVPLAALAWMWWLQRQRVRSAETAQRALQPGQQVILTSGLVGRLVEREGPMARLEVAPGVVLTVDARALMGEAPSTLHPTGGATADPTAPSKEAD